MLGDKEALLLLSTAYQSGQAFAADSSKAYLYAFALAQISKGGPSKSLVALLKSLEGQLSADELAAAQRDGATLDCSGVRCVSHKQQIAVRSE
jgi:hypothetical protein